jgi:hypothetical protein
MKRVRLCSIVFFLANFCVAGCGNRDGTIPPTAPQAIADITGTWTQESGGTRTWNLTQAGIQAGGKASFSQDGFPNLGTVSGAGGVLGAVAFGAFNFAETYEGVSISSMPGPNSCYVDVNGQLTISGNSMTGTYTELVGCAGVRVGQFTGRLTMQRH